MILNDIITILNIISDDITDNSPNNISNRRLLL